MKSNDDEYFCKISKILTSMTTNYTLKLRNEILRAMENKNKILIAGNGGSNAIAAHFVTDLNKLFFRKKVSFSIYSVGQNSALTTAISNDYGFEFNLAAELNTLANRDDLLILISSSGRSKNIINALNWARENQIQTFSILGFLDSEAELISDNYLNLNLSYGEYGIAEDIHSIICHSVTYSINQYMEKFPNHGLINEPKLKEI